MNRGTAIAEASKLKKLQSLPKLRALVLAGNIFKLFILKFNILIELFIDSPIAETDDYRLEVLIAVRRLERLDKEQYQEDERTEAEEIYEQRRQKELEDAATAASANGFETNETAENES